MNVWMQVIAAMEYAIDACELGSVNNSIHLWDEAVAFYTGLIAAQGNGKGNLLYSLVNKHCENFKTCGPDGNMTFGNSKVNIEIFNLFHVGQAFLLEGQCVETRPVLKRISTLMGVPLIQGTLDYALHC